MKIFLLIIVILFPFTNALPCSFIGYPEPPLSFFISKYRTIYVGKVISKSSVREKDKDGDWFRVHKMNLKVEKAIKGVDKEIQQVVTYERLGPKDSCSEEPQVLKIGEKWIVHSNFDQDSKSKSNFRRLFIRKPSCRNIQNSNPISAPDPRFL